LALLLLACVYGQVALAQTAAQALPAEPNLPISGAAIIPGERLSIWMQRNAASSADTTALHWRVAAERSAQEQLRSAVRQSLGPLAVAPWLARLPVTGRLPLAYADGRWLELSIPNDPILGSGQTVSLLPRPDMVALLNESAALCLVPHRAGAFAADYLRACAQQDAASFAGPVDRAWVAQPDGRAAGVGVAAWNQQTQDEPGPGAWIWAPSRAAGVSSATSGNLARFLATQLPAEMLLPELGQGFVRADLPQQAPARPPRDLSLTASDWGEIGLLQTPTARMEPAGAIRLNISAGWPYTRATTMLQPVDWLEVGFRYVDLQNQLYGASIAGSQTLKDKSIDLKLHLLEEDATAPQVALGLRDIGGTGLFSGEYVVANKRWGNWDASAGLGWGSLGLRGNIRAPLGFLGESFKTRGVADVGQGGTVQTGGMFHGDAAPFGGVQWHAPNNRWLLKAELDGNDYHNEPGGTNLDAKSPFNWGAVYRYSPSLDLTVAWERGDRLSFGLNVHGAISQFEVPKVLDPAPPSVQVAPAAPIGGSNGSGESRTLQQDWANAAQMLDKYTGWQTLEFDQQFSTLTVRAETDDALFVQERVQRALAVLHNLAPLSVKRFVLQLQRRGVALSRIEVDRAEWLAPRTQAQPPSLKLPAERLYPGTLEQSAVRDAPTYQRPGRTDASVLYGPSYNQILGGPDGFLLYEIGVQARFEKHFTPNTWLSANVNARLLDNYEGFKFTGASQLPRVRTYAREFVTTSRVTMGQLQLSNVQDLGGGHYGSVYGGMLEDMYGGVGAEWLYRPWQSKVAFGVDVNHVQQRDFAVNFAFRDYAVNTGHATLYWDTAWNDVQVKLSAGQYLACDTGATLDVKRVFPNGTSIGAWATRTNVSAEQFGEGSFDKGIYVTIPFDVMLPKSGPGTANVAWNPLTRDGGARLGRSVTLFDLTNQRDARTWGFSSSPSKASNRFVSAEDRSYVEQEPSANLWQYTGASASALGRGIATTPASTWLWGGIAVLGASLFDKNVDQWAQDHQGGNWDRAATIANGLPYALAAGTGILFTGIAGDDAAATAKISLTAGAYAIGGNMLTKYAVGRSRPANEMGSSSFNGFTPSAAQSSFASNHMALAFALVTPFAQANDNPWLYALAASTAIGRVQSREHWLSDTVAGSLMGYAIGSLVYEQQHGGKHSFRIGATPQSVNATWSF
jgi:membrane-associated phospholipid phosphatase